MKIGNLQFKEYAAKKPVAFAPDGTFLDVSHIAAAAPVLGLAASPHLSKADQVKLTVERIALEPDFSLTIFGSRTLKKDAVIQEVRDQTPFGKIAVEAQVRYCDELVTAVREGASRVPPIPKSGVSRPPQGKVTGRNVAARGPTQVLFCENTTDDVTTPFAKYRMDKVHPAFVKRGFQVIVLQDVEDVRNNFVPKATDPLTAYISGVGHGFDTMYTGHKLPTEAEYNHILEVGKYDAGEVAGRAIHLLSCKTAKTLGPDTVANGATSYAGYIDSFVVKWDNPATSAVNEFQLFARSDSAYDLCMAAGNTAQVAFDTAVATFTGCAAQVAGSEAATWLTYDRGLLKLIGDPTATILPYQGALVAAGQPV